MSILQLTAEERIQFQNVLPVCGSLKGMQLAKQIIDKVKINDVKDINSTDTQEIDFNDEEVQLMQEMISIRNNQQQIYFSSLSLIEKFLSIKEK